MKDEEFIGDGVYVSFNGWQIRLRAPREHGDHVVFIEPRMWANLVEYAQKVWNPNKENNNG